MEHNPGERGEHGDEHGRKISQTCLPSSHFPFIPMFPTLPVALLLNPRPGFQ